MIGLRQGQCAASIQLTRDVSRHNLRLGDVLAIAGLDEARSGHRRGRARGRAGRARSGRGRTSSPPSRSAAPARVRTSGTGFVVCAVCGLTPSSSSSFSALPWSAVTRHTPPARCVASTTVAEARVHRLDRLDDGRDDARVPDHVGIREVDDAEAVSLRRAPRRPATRPRARTSPASGRSSRRRAATGRGSASSPGHGSSTPPLKKYVTCAYFSVSAAWSCRSAGAAQDLGEGVRDVLLAERDRAVERRRCTASSSRRRRPPRAAAASAAGPGRAGS